MLYHFCTNGLTKSLIFSAEEDFIYGMNAIAICKVKFSDVMILAFCLMDNHVHFILDCTEQGGVRFIRYYKQLVGNFIQKKYGKERNLSGADIGYKIMTDPAYAIRAIAYVLRNPTSAGLPIMPSEYRWSSAHLYFGSRAFKQDSFRHVKTLNINQSRKLTKSHCVFPGDWRVDGKGMIFPGDYTEYSTVEKIFLRPSQLLFYLLKNNDADIEKDTGILTKCHYSDEEICASRDILINKAFNQKSLSCLPVEDRISLASMLRKRYGLSIPVLGRVTGVDRELLKRML